MIRRIIAYTLFFSLSIGLSAQVCNTIYFMDRVPQSSQLNPAFQPKCDFYFGLPNLQYNFRNSFSLNDLLSYNSQLDSLLTPLHPLNNVNQFLSKLSPKNNMINSFQVEPFSLGFRIKDFYFSMSVAAKMDASLKYPTDLVKLSLTGVLDSTTSYDFANLGLDAIAYGEFALAVSKNYNDEFTVGVRAKLLSGVFNLSSNNTKFNLFSSMDNNEPKLNIKSDLNILTSSTFFKIDTNSKGQLTIESQKVNADNFKVFQNPGFGLDLGFSYTAIDKFILSASLLDLGFINWRIDQYQYKLKGDTSFLGIDSIDFFHSNSDLQTKFLDSLENTFKYTKYSTTYTTWLPAKLYLGVEYAPASFFSLGFLSMSQLYRKQFYQQFMLSANLRLFRMFMLSTSYSIFDNGFSNLGVGLSFRMSPPLLYFIPLNIYFISDNIPFRFSSGKYPVPYKLNAFNFRFGMNIVFGCSQKRRMRDKPLILD